MDAQPATTNSDSTNERNKVFDYVRTMLGDGMVDVELDPIHYETALDRALTRFRQKSSNAVEESYSFLELIQDVNEYRLPDEIINVQSVFRRAIGSRSGLGAGGTNLSTSVFVASNRTPPSSTSSTENCQPNQDLVPPLGITEFCERSGPSPCGIWELTV